MTSRWFDCAGPWRRRHEPSFAGPRTTWRGARVDEPGQSYEVVEYYSAFTEEPREGELVIGIDTRPYTFVKCAGGATLGEIIDESIKQGARLDPAFAIHVLARVAPGIVATAGAHMDVSSDTVLVGFDGSVDQRARLPWWRSATAPHIPYDQQAVNHVCRTLRCLGEMAAEAIMTERWPIPGLMFLALPKKLRRATREVVRELVNDTVMFRPGDDDEYYYDHPTGPDAQDVLQRLLALEKLVDVVTPEQLGGLVKNLFAERWAREQRVMEELS